MKKLIFDVRKRTMEMVIAGLAFALGVVMEICIRQAEWLTKSRSAVNNPGFVPNIVAIALLILSALLFLSAFKVNKTEKVTLNLNALLLMCIWWIFAIIAEYTGFILGAAIALAASLLLWGERKPLTIILISVIAPVVTWFILGYLMKVRFPVSFLGF